MPTAMEIAAKELEKLIYAANTPMNAIEDIKTLDPSYTPSRTINTAGDVTRDMQAQFIRATNGWRIYNSLSELGITEGTETMEQICAAMANLSELRYIKTTSNPSSAYPATSGMLFVRRYASYRVELHFFRGSSNGVADEWIGYYDVNITPNFTGWQKVAKDSDIINYETGTWTPELQFGGASTGITYNYRYGRYVRVGNVVHWWVDIYLSSKGSSAGNATVKGLPYPSFSSSPVATSVGVVGGVTFPQDVTGVHFTLLSGDNKLTVRCYGDGVAATVPLTDTHFSNTSTIRAEGKYFI